MQSPNYNLWTSYLEKQSANIQEQVQQLIQESGLFPAQVTSVYPDRCQVYATNKTEPFTVKFAGRRAFPQTESGTTKIAVGDWLLLTTNNDEAGIHLVLPRFSLLSRRKVAKKSEAQLMCTNAHYTALVHGLDKPVKTNQLERFLAAVETTGSRPVFILNKLDLAPDPTTGLLEVSRITEDAKIILTSTVSGSGINELKQLIGQDTMAMLGLSGVGKSSIINYLLGNETQSTGHTRDDKRGRHITSRRNLYYLPGGGAVIDMPGVREFGIWPGTTPGEGTAFAAIHELAGRCKYNDCTHTVEPGCAVLAALEAGEIEKRMYDNFIKLQEEAGELSEKMKTIRANERRRHEKEVQSYSKIAAKLRKFKGRD